MSRPEGRGHSAALARWRPHCNLGGEGAEGDGRQRRGGEEWRRLLAVFITDGSEGERVGAKLSADVDKRPVRREGDAGGGGEGVRRWQPIPCESERRASGDH